MFFLIVNNFTGSAITRITNEDKRNGINLVAIIELYFIYRPKFSQLTSKESKFNFLIWFKV